jgi:hypothetical protein
MGRGGGKEEEGTLDLSKGRVKNGRQTNVKGKREGGEGGGGEWPFLDIGAWDKKLAFAATKEEKKRRIFASSNSWKCCPCKKKGWMNAE